MAFNVYKLLVAIIITSASLTLLFPFFGSVLPAPTANALNISAYDAQQTFNHSIYGNLNRTLIGSCKTSVNNTSGNCTGSFFASVTNPGLSALAFVIYGFGNIVLSLLNIPGVFINLISLSLFYLPGFNGEALVVTAITEFIVIFLFILFAQSWMKSNLLSAS